MARSIDEILSEINAKAASYPSLESIEQNTSVVQVWRAVKQVMALGIAQIDQSIDALKAELDDKINTHERGGIEWYREQVLAYQHGDPLTLINNRPKYASLNEGAQIVKHVSVSEVSGGGLDFKVAGNEGSEISPLTTDQLAGVKSYLNQIKFAGTKFTLSSLPANLVDYKIVAEIDRSVFNDAETKTAIAKKIKEYHISFDFNDTLYLNHITDALQSIEGIIDIQITRAHILIDEARIEFTRKYNPPSGYVMLDADNLNITIEM